jgi:hypothetical protein
MRDLNREPSIDASYQVPVHLAKWFQRRRLKCEKLTNDRQRTPSDGKSSHYQPLFSAKDHCVQKLVGLIT